LDVSKEYALYQIHREHPTVGLPVVYSSGATWHLERQVDAIRAGFVLSGSPENYPFQHSIFHPSCRSHALVVGTGYIARQWCSFLDTPYQDASHGHTARLVFDDSDYRRKGTIMDAAF